MHSETHYYLVLCTQISSRIISYFEIEISFLWYYMKFFLSQYFRSMYVVCVSKNFFFLNTGLFCKETQGMFSTEYPSWVITVRRSRDVGHFRCLQRKAEESSSVGSSSGDDVTACVELKRQSWDRAGCISRVARQRVMNYLKNSQLSVMSQGKEMTDQEVWRFVISWQTTDDLHTQTQKQIHSQISYINSNTCTRTHTHTRAHTQNK